MSLERMEWVAMGLITCKRYDNTSRHLKTTQKLFQVGLGECTPLPQPKNRPSGGYHPAGAGIHDFMGTCTIGTVSQHPKLGQAVIDPKHLA